MQIVKQISDSLLGLGLAEKLGVFLYPALILVSLFLLFFARHSFKLFKIGLPLLGAAAGYVAGSKAFGDLLASKLPEVAKMADPAIVAGVACALVLALFCMKARTITVLLIGLCIGYAVVGDVAIKALRDLKFVSDIVLAVDMKTAVMLAAVISVICAVVTMFLLKKFFNVFYTFVTSVGLSMVAFILPAFFIFTGADLKPVLMASDIGAVLGFILFLKQYSYHKYVW